MRRALSSLRFSRVDIAELIEPTYSYSLLHSSSSKLPAMKAETELVGRPGFGIVKWSYPRCDGWSTSRSGRASRPTSYGPSSSDSNSQRISARPSSRYSGRGTSGFLQTLSSAQRKYDRGGGGTDAHSLLLPCESGVVVVKATSQGTESLASRTLTKARNWFRSQAGALIVRRRGCRSRIRFESRGSREDTVAACHGRSTGRVGRKTGRPGDRRW